MGIMITYCGHNNPVYNVHENMGTHYTQEHTATHIVHGKYSVCHDTETMSFVPSC